eukprot:169924_1
MDTWQLNLVEKARIVMGIYRAMLFRICIVENSQALEPFKVVDPHTKSYCISKISKVGMYYEFKDKQIRIQALTTENIDTLPGYDKPIPELEVFMTQALSFHDTATGLRRQMIGIRVKIHTTNKSQTLFAVNLIFRNEHRKSTLPSSRLIFIDNNKIKGQSATEIADSQTANRLLLRRGSADSPMITTQKKKIMPKPNQPTKPPMAKTKYMAKKPPIPKRTTLPRGTPLAAGRKLKSGADQNENEAQEELEQKFNKHQQLEAKYSQQREQTEKQRAKAAKAENAYRSDTASSEASTTSGEDEDEESSSSASLSVISSGIGINIKKLKIPKPKEIP